MSDNIPWDFFGRVHWSWVIILYPKSLLNLALWKLTRLLLSGTVKPLSLLSWGFKIPKINKKTAMYHAHTNNPTKSFIFVAISLTHNWKMIFVFFVVLWDFFFSFYFVNSPQHTFNHLYTITSHLPNITADIKLIFCFMWNKEDDVFYFILISGTIKYLKRRSA